MTYQTLTCPNCQGSGCPTCQNTGKVRVAESEMQKLKQMVGEINPTLQSQAQDYSLPQPVNSSTQLNHRANLAGIIAFSILSLILGGAAASWYFLKTLKPFFAGFISLLTLISGKIVLDRPFFQLQEPNDFLSAIKRI